MINQSSNVQQHEETIAFTSVTVAGLLKLKPENENTLWPSVDVDLAAQISKCRIKMSKARIQ